jgi:hypothetical protein
VIDRKPRTVRRAYPPEVFGQVTDLLAELVLEDLRQFPSLTGSQGIDIDSRAENTALPALVSRGTS